MPSITLSFKVLMRSFKCPFFAWITLPPVISGSHIQTLPVIQCSHSLTDWLTDCYQAYCLTGQFFKKLKIGVAITLWFEHAYLFQFWFCFRGVHYKNLICIYSITLPFRLNICILSWKLKQHIQSIVEATSWVLSHPFSTAVILVILLFVLNKGPFAVFFKKSQEIHEVCVTQYNFTLLYLLKALLFMHT